MSTDALSTHARSAATASTASAERPAHLRSNVTPVLEVRDLVVNFPVRHHGIVHAVSGISFDILEGETMGLVGESGCGKSTTGHAIVQLVQPTAGSIHLDGVDLASLPPEELRRKRPAFQMIFQDPIASLNPLRNVRGIVEEPLQIWRRNESGTWKQKVWNALEEVGLDPDIVAHRRPREFSGGQLQRISIARALVLNPRLVVCDEPVSSLDVSVQAQIINLLRSMQERHRLTLLFIAHDLAVVKNISDRLAVMYLGRLCEIGDSDAVYEHPAHHYTRALLASVPKLGRKTLGAPLTGELPSAVNPPSGCRFRTRCPAATSICAQVEPPMEPIGHDHFVACHHPVLDAVPVTVAAQPPV
jgi:peptide/nickel transport system ATP-binding protein